MNQTSDPRPDFRRLRDECKASDATIAKLCKRFPALTTATIVRHLIVCNNEEEKAAVHIDACQMWRQSMFPMVAVPYSQVKWKIML